MLEKDDLTDHPFYYDLGTGNVAIEPSNGVGHRCGFAASENLLKNKSSDKDK